jgi:8-oxo-dGTP pyrophosphatase MutT (NUDIX family)
MRHAQWAVFTFYFLIFTFSMLIYTEQDIREVHDDAPELAQYFKIVAAGGVVLNEQNELLMIFRRGKWDLPKGKLENNEPVELCAERETKEETGLTELQFRRFLKTTYHTYTEKKQLVLKETHWFLFSTPGVPRLIPQTEEDIFKAEWVARENLENYTANTFNLILDVLKEAGMA